MKRLLETLPASDVRFGNLRRSFTDDIGPSRLCTLDAKRNIERQEMIVSFARKLTSEDLDHNTSS